MNFDCRPLPESFGIPTRDPLAPFPLEQHTSNAKVEAFNNLERVGEEGGLIAAFRERERSVSALGECEAGGVRDVFVSEIDDVPQYFRAGDLSRLLNRAPRNDADPPALLLLLARLSPLRPYGKTPDPPPSRREASPVVAAYVAKKARVALQVIASRTSTRSCL